MPAAESIRMTLILGLMNRRYAVLVSDRRLTIDGRMAEDESNKAATFDCADGRLAIAFTGLAKAGAFVTNRWLLDAFAEAAEPDYLALPTIHRVAKLATDRFKTLPVGRASAKSLSVLCAGYLYDAANPSGLLALLSNFERLDGGPLASPNSEFIVDSRRAQRDIGSVPSAALVVGVSKAVSDEHMGALVELVRDESRPADALVGKAVAVLRAAADSPKAMNSIGKQCTSIVLSSNPDEPVLVEYHSARRSYVVRGVSHVSARGPGLGIFEIADPERGITVNNMPIILRGPDLGRNQPCWCGAKRPDGLPKKYKHCHGRR